MKKLLIIIFITYYSNMAHSNGHMKCAVKVPEINRSLSKKEDLSKTNLIMYKKAILLYENKQYCNSLNILTRLSQKGIHETHKYIGAILFFGFNNEPNITLGSSYIISAAKLGDIESQLLAGLIYENGKGVLKNIDRAKYWYRNAFNNLVVDAKKGDHYAQYNLAVLYENGKGVDKNIYKAIYWYRIASKNGDKEASERLNHLKK